MIIKWASGVIHQGQYYFVLGFAKGRAYIESVMGAPALHQILVRARAQYDIVVKAKPQYTIVVVAKPQYTIKVGTYE